MNNEALLHGEIKAQLEYLGGTEIGAEEYQTVADRTLKFIDRAIEIEKLNLEHLEKEQNRERENELKQKQMEEEQRDRLVKNCISVAGIVLPSVITIWGVLKSFEFEKEGTITTIMGRGFINKLLPKK